MAEQNRSSAVMQQRQEAKDALDDFPTPMWATRALCDWLKSQGHVLDCQSVREPACNRGYMAKPLGEYFGEVVASDCHDYGAGYPVDDYLFGPAPDDTDWTITNPPFVLAQQFIERAIGSSRVGVAMFVRSAFLEGRERYRTLFKPNPPTSILQFTERVILHKSAMRYKGEKYIDHKGVERSASSATAYSWLIWEYDNPEIRPGFHWIPPCQDRLQRPGDYRKRGDL